MHSSLTTVTCIGRSEGPIYSGRMAFARLSLEATAPWPVRFGAHWHVMAGSFLAAAVPAPRPTFFALLCLSANGRLAVRE